MLDKTHRVWVRTSRDADHHIRFEVQDNGAGMTEEVRAHLFTSFFSTKGAKGTGLGLLVTRKLIQKHQGVIEVETRLGHGTRFIFRLPIMSLAVVAENGLPTDRHPQKEDAR